MRVSRSGGGKGIRVGQTECQFDVIFVSALQLHNRFCSWGLLRWSLLKTAALSVIAVNTARSCNLYQATKYSVWLLTLEKPAKLIAECYVLPSLPQLPEPDERTKSLLVVLVLFRYYQLRIS